MTDTPTAPTAFRGPQPDAGLFDLSAWPIVHIRFPELDEPDRVLRILTGLERLLAQETPFVAVWTPASHDHDDEPHEDERTSNLWIKRHKLALNTHCKGYGYVTGDPALRELLSSRIKTISGRLFTFAMFVAETRAEADRHAAAILDTLGEGRSA